MTAGRASSSHRLKLFYPDTPDLPLPPGHRFPAAKYRLLREHLLAAGIVAADELVPAPLAQRQDLLLAHDAAYVDAVLAGQLEAEAQRRLGLPWSKVLVRRALATVGGAVAAARGALANGLSGQLAGGTHHAHRTFGSGFCVFNDFATAALLLLAEGTVARLAILDLDVHQGDGTAAILASEPRAFVASVHGAGNFPFRKVASDLDIPVPDGADDAPYLAAVEQALAAVEDHRPDLLLYIAGADPLAEDRLGRLSLTAAGLAARDTRVFAFCRDRRLPVAFALGGGYAEPIEATIAAYAATVRIACETFRGG